MNWKKLTIKELCDMAEWAYYIGMHYLAKLILKDIEDQRSGRSK